MKTKKQPLPDLETIIPLLIGMWRRLHKEAGPSASLQTREFRNVVASIQALEENGFHGHEYFEDKQILGAYLLYYWVLHYQQALSLIGELPTSPGRVLDICSGPAAMAFAALKHGASEVYATDKNETVLKIGADLCGRYGFPLNIRHWDCLKQSLPIQGKFDLIILGHCLEELFPSSTRDWSKSQEQFIKRLIENYLSDKGFLILVDGSFLESNRRLLSLRDSLVEFGIPIQAPCVWRGQCPVLQLENSPCYAQRPFEKPYLIRELQRAASINLSSLKMSYLILRNPKMGWPSLSTKDQFRVISPPVSSFQGKRFYLCGTTGKKTLGTRLNEHPAESRAFEFLKRGELLSVENALESQNALDIIKGTVVRIEASCGKPIKEFYSNE